MDGTGAQQAASAIQQNLNDHDTAIVFDLGGVDYLSSAGLRVFQDSIRKMKERKGHVAVCRPQDFVLKLLTSGGFTKVLSVYSSVEEALGHGGNAAVSAPGGKHISGNGWTLTGEHISDKPVTLSVMGNLQAVHDGNISVQEISLTRGCSHGFCVGIGAMGNNREMAAPLAGEMISLNGTVCWIPTDGHLTPDFFTAEDSESSGMKSFSFFNAGFTGPFTDMIRISSDKPDGMTLAEVYDGIFRYAREHYPDFKGICAVAMKATISGLCSSDMKTSLLAASADRSRNAPVAMPGGKTVTELPFDGSVAEKISHVDVKPRYAGDVLISIGYGIDLTLAEKAFPAESLSSLYYKDPRTPANRVFLYNKGAVFKNLRWDNTAGFETQIGTAAVAGEFVAMHNLLNITKLRSAQVGLSLVSAIRKEK
jgi:anti-anti-sigma factor